MSNQKTKTNPLDQGTLQTVKVSDLVPSPFNPRIVNEKSESFHDLVESIRGRGVVVPVHVRTHPTKKGKFELLAGERRRRAAIKAGAQNIPAVNHGDIDDALAFEICFIENFAREDLTPLEQGRAVDMLLTKYKGDSEAVASKLGKSIRWVQRRKALGTRLSKVWIDGMAEKHPMREWTTAHLQIIASLPTEVQDDFYEQYVCDEMPSVAELSKHVASVMHLLRMSPFDLAVAGCTECQKRTSITPGLWEDNQDKKAIRVNDRCLDDQCWTDKVLAWLETTYKEKLVDLPNLVPIATEYMTSGTLVHMAEKHPAFTNALDKYQYDACPKSATNAFPGFVVFGKAVGTILWCKPVGQAAEKKSKKQTPGTATPLKIRRIMLESKRATEFLLRVAAVVKDKNVPGDMINTSSIMDMDLMLLALVDAFGVLDKYCHTANDQFGKADTMAPWRQYDKAMRNQKQIRRSLWSNLLPVLCNSLVYNGPKSQTTPERVKAAKKLAGLFAIDTNAIAKQIKKDMPEPKSWAKLNEDGIPKAKKEKAKTKTKSEKKTAKKTKVRKCRVCGCTQTKPCIVKVGSGRGLPCHWLEQDLCSAPACAMDQHKGMGQKAKKKTKKAPAKKKSSAKAKRKRPAGMIKPKP